MTTISGIPAHALLVHAIVVLAPLTAGLLILCAIWPAARRRLVWLVLAFAVVTMALTPLTVEAGEWLFDQQSTPSAVLQTHAELGDWMPYLAAALLAVAIVQVVLHLVEGRSDKRRTVAAVVVAVVTLVVGLSAVIGVFRIGHTGAEAVWGAAE